MSTKPFHDRFARFNLADPELARLFLDKLVRDPRLEHTDLHRLRPARDAHIKSNLGELITDLLYTVPYKDHQAYLAVLVEHKSEGALSGPRNNFPFLLRKQEVAVMDEHRRTHHEGLMPSVFMIGLYHGGTLYSGPRTVAESMDAPPELIPNHWKEDGSLIVDLGTYSDDFLDGLGGRLAVFLQVLKHIYDKDILPTIERILPTLQELETEHRDFIVSIFTYLFGTSGEENKTQLDQIALQSFSEETGGAIMTIAEQLRNEGKIEEKHAIAFALIAERIPSEIIAKSTGLTLEEIQRLSAQKR